MWLQLAQLIGKSKYDNMILNRIILSHENALGKQSVLNMMCTQHCMQDGVHTGDIYVTSHTNLFLSPTLTCFAWLCMTHACWQQTQPAAQTWTGPPARRPPHLPCPYTSGDSAVTRHAAGCAGRLMRPGRIAASGHRTHG